MEQKVTVVTVTYNCASVLQETIDSVVGQTYPDVEYIVVDGGSTDGTVDIIRKNADRITRWVSEPDGGIYDAMNKGAAMATGEWINFMNAGDAFYSCDALGQLMQEIKPDTQVVYGDIWGVTPLGEYLIKPERLEVFRSHIPMCHQATLVQTKLMQQEPFDIRFRIGADYNFLYHQYIGGAKFQYVPVPVARYDGLDGVSSINYWKMHKDFARTRGRVDVLKYYVRRAVSGAKQTVKKMLPLSLQRKAEQHNKRKFVENLNKR